MRGSRKKPLRKFQTNRYSHFIQSQDQEVMTAAKTRAWAVYCARYAVENMMTDDLDALYEPGTPTPARKRP